MLELQCILWGLVEVQVGDHGGVYDGGGSVVDSIIDQT